MSSPGQALIPMAIAASRAVTPYRKRTRAAYNMARAAYDYGPSARVAGRLINKAAKKYMRSKKSGPKAPPAARNIGHNAKLNNAKIVETDVRETQALATRVLYSVPLLSNINKQTDFIEYTNKRERDMIDLRGLKLCYAFRNDINIPINVNVALVHDKRSKPAEVSVSTDGFFRGDGGASRSRNFNTFMNSIEFHCTPLNTDRFDVLMHKRFHLGTGSATATYNTNVDRNFINLMEYVPVNRQIRYDDDNNPEDQIWMVWWADRVFTDSGNPGTATAWTMHGKTQAFFKEVCCK